MKKSSRSSAAHPSGDNPHQTRSSKSASTYQRRSTSAPPHASMSVPQLFSLQAYPQPALLLHAETALVLDLNDAFCTLIGFSRDALLGNSLPELGFWKNPEQLDTLLAQLHTAASPCKLRTALLSHTGIERWVSCTAAALRDGNATYFLFLFEDITELLQEHAALQKELLQVQKKLLELQQLSQVGFWEYDLRTGKISWSPVIFEWFGLSPESGEPDYERFLAAHLPDSAARLRQAVERAIQTGEPYRLELEAHHSGRTFCYIGAGEVERDETGQPTKLFGTAQNITERKQLEKSLRESKALLESIIDTAAIGICVTDEEGRYVLVNPAYCRTYGYSEEELLGKHFSLVIPDEDKLKASNTHSAFIAGDPHSSGEWRLLHKDGRLLDIYVNARLLVREDGRRFKVTTVEDITERKRAAKRLKEAEEALMQSQKMEAIGTLASGIAHDFNNLLGGILGNVKLLYRRTDPSDEYLQIPLRRIESAAHRAAKLTSQLLGFARKGKYQSVAFNGVHAMERVLDILSHTIDRRIHISTHFAPHLPPIVGDQNQIEQVFLNVLVNAVDAIQATLKERKKGEIRIHAALYVPTDADARKWELSPSRKYIRFSISDTGTGIPEEVLPRIFDPFFTTKEVGKGTGLGLSMAYGIMKSHHGSIAVETALGTGTTFHLYFPTDLAADEEPAAPTTTIHHFQPKLTMAEKKHKILVIEDEEMLREMLSEVFTELGIEVVIGTNGEDGLHQFNAHHGQFDLILLNMNMPQMDGEAVYDELLKYPDLPPVIILTGYANEEVLSRLQEKGVHRIITKPYDIDELTAAVLELLAARSQLK
ncbi:MAG: PAS domain S-box protein [Chloroherpetonaceae bacterium]|nr:PAS domain S-box protein [Chloroherpetonaceae bacterium]